MSLCGAFVSFCVFTLVFCRLLSLYDCFVSLCFVPFCFFIVVTCHFGTFLCLCVRLVFVFCKHFMSLCSCFVSPVYILCLFVLVVYVLYISVWLCCDLSVCPYGYFVSSMTVCVPLCLFLLALKILLFSL